MAKKNKSKAKSNPEVEIINQNEQNVEVETTAKAEEPKENKEKVKASDKKVKSKKQAKKTKQSSFSDKIKGTYNELKKVTWPSFGKVVKQTGVVLAFVIIFVLILLGFNSLFGWLFDLFTKATV